MNTPTTHPLFIRLENPDEALRIILHLLIRDPSYQLLPMRQINTFYQSVLNNNYILLRRNEKVLGVILWAEITRDVAETCLSNQRSPYVNELAGIADTLSVIGFTGSNFKDLLVLWRFFAKTHRHRDILIHRHFRSGKRTQKPVILFRDNKRIRISKPATTIASNNKI